MQKCKLCQNEREYIYGQWLCQDCDLKATRSLAAEEVERQRKIKKMGEAIKSTIEKQTLPRINGVSVVPAFMLLDLINLLVEKEE